MITGPVWWALTPADILMQLDHQPTFAAVDVRNPFEPYGRVPKITVYRDGTILYRGSFPHESGFFVTRYGSTVVQHHLDHVLELEEHVGTWREPSVLACSLLELGAWSYQHPQRRWT
jgi:hypothetical protein